jgi:hypothetical protein
MSTDPFALPARLPELVARYSYQTTEAVRFRMPSWEAALAEVSGHPTKLLADPAITTEPTTRRFAALGDRVVTRAAVIDACTSLDLADDAAVVAAFVLVMAWGSGTSHSRSLRNTSKALREMAAAAAVLRQSAAALRSIKQVNDAAIADVHRRFSLPGVREAFFTKWFAFAGFAPDRDWQPLIFDRRVRATLHSSLGVWINRLATRRSDPARYVAYLIAMHRWAAELPQPMTATQLEWIMFTHNGRPL